MASGKKSKKKARRSTLEATTQLQVETQTAFRKLWSHLHSEIAEIDADLSPTVTLPVPTLRGENAAAYVAALAPTPPPKDHAMATDSAVRADEGENTPLPRTEQLVARRRQLEHAVTVVETLFRGLTEDHHAAAAKFRGLALQAAWLFGAVAPPDTKARGAPVKNALLSLVVEGVTGRPMELATSTSDPSYRIGRHAYDAARLKAGAALFAAEGEEITARGGFSASPLLGSSLDARDRSVGPANPDASMIGGLAWQIAVATMDARFAPFPCSLEPLGLIERFTRVGARVSRFAGEREGRIMSKKVDAAFQLEPLLVRIDRILPTRKLTDSVRDTPRYKTVAASVREVGIIEPPIVFPEKGSRGMYLLLDGHVRIDVLREMGEKEVLCLVSRDDENCTYNSKVSRIAPIQEDRMIRRAIASGVPEARIAKALNLSEQTIKRTKKLLENAKVVKFLAQRKAELLGSLQEVVEAASLEA